MLIIPSISINAEIPPRLLSRLCMATLILSLGFEVETYLGAIESDVHQKKRVMNLHIAKFILWPEVRNKLAMMNLLYNNYILHENRQGWSVERRRKPGHDCSQLCENVGVQ